MNIVIKDSKWHSSDLQTLFGDEEVSILEADDISRLAVIIGAYPSTSQARRAGRIGPIPPGWTEMKISKKMHIWIWNPDEY